MTTNPLLAQAHAAKEDQTEDNGSFERRVIPAGYTLARFIGYVEIGKRPQRAYQGKEKPPAQEVRLSFELLGKDNIREVGEGDEKKTVTDILGVKITKKSGDRAGFVKLLKKMAYGRDGVVNFAQMLSEGFLVKIVHNKTKDAGGNDVTYANMKDEDGNWTIFAPMKVDQLTNETTPIEVPAHTADLRLLLWDNPTIEQWNSLFIDGTYETKDKEGNTVQKSKNWLQEDIVNSALDFKGSKLEELLLASSTPGLEAMTMAGDQGAQESENPAPVQTTVAPETPAPAPAEPAQAPVQAAPTPTPAAVATVDQKNASDAEAAAAAQAIFDNLGV